MAPVILLAASPDDILVFQLLEETYLPQCCTGHPLGKGENSGHFITPTVHGQHFHSQRENLSRQVSNHKTNRSATFVFLLHCSQAVGILSHLTRVPPHRDHLLFTTAFTGLMHSPNRYKTRTFLCIYNMTSLLTPTITI